MILYTEDAKDSTRKPLELINEYSKVAGYKNNTQKSMREAGCSGLVHWDDPERWDGEAGGRGGSAWGTHAHPWRHVNAWQNHHNTVK